MTALLDMRNVCVSFDSRRGTVDAVKNVSFQIAQGESVALVGASGSGKTVLSRAIMGLVDEPGYVTGSIRFEGEEIVGQSESELRKLRGLGVAMVFQDALDGLNPVFTIGSQLKEIFTVRMGLSNSEAKKQAVELMERVGIRNAAERYHNYPHQFSGGMRQRICIALAVGLQPKLLIADEPTTALDVTVQAGILRLMKSLQEKTGMGMIFVTHDLAVAHQISDRIIVMYNGNVVEEGPTAQVFQSPRHPYTQALMAAHPGRVRSWRDLSPIPEEFVTDGPGEGVSSSGPSVATALN